MLRRMLMNAVGDNLSSTIAPAPAEAPATAPSAPANPPLTATAIAEALKADPSLHNAVMATLRRGGAMSAAKAEPVNATTPAPAPTSTEPARPVNVLAELQRLRALDQARASAGVNATPAQVAIMEEAFAAKNPPDAAAWAADYVAVMFAGMKPPAAAATQPVSQPAAAPVPVPTPAPTNATNVPTPPAPVVDQSTRPILSLNEAERYELQRRIGPSEFTKRLMAEMRSVKISVR